MCGSGRQRRLRSTSMSMSEDGGTGGRTAMSLAKRAVLSARNGSTHPTQRAKSTGAIKEYVPHARVIHSEKSEAYRALGRMKHGNQEEARKLEVRR